LHFSLFTFHFLLFLAFHFLCASGSGAQETAWPEFRGPTGQGHSTGSGLPLLWSEGHNIIWKRVVPGRGWSSPVVADGRVWLTTAVADDRRGASLRALAFDVETGSELVNVEAFRLSNANLKNPKNSHASPTPILDGSRVYVHFGGDGTAALDTTTGAVIWSARFPYASQHGSGGSPVLYKDLLIFSGDGHYEAWVIALDTRTGKVRWKTERRKPFDQAYTTPLVINVNGRDQVVSVGAYRAAAYDPATGRELWMVRYEGGFSNVPRPVFGEGLVFITTGFQQPALLAVRPDGKGDVTATHVAWSMTRGAPFTPSPILVGDELYVISDLGVLSCVDAATGKLHFQQRIGGNHSASPIFADGRIYFLSEEGVATVIAPGRTFQKLAANELDGAALASMAVARESIFIRTLTHLYRIGDPARTSAGAAGTR
jgi:outer membrane protein assembly factor BamB